MMLDRAASDPPGVQRAPEAPRGKGDRAQQWRQGKTGKGGGKNKDGKPKGGKDKDIKGPPKPWFLANRDKFRGKSKGGGKGGKAKR